MRKGGTSGPVVDERGPKKRSWPRFSLRRLLHPSPLLVRRLLNVAPPASTRVPVPTDATSSNGESPVDSTKVSLEPRLHDDSVSNKTSASSGPARSDGLVECSLCLNELEPQYLPNLLTCSHKSCYYCFQIYLRIEISESRVIITCPQCSEPMHPNDIRMILNDKTQYEKYEDFMVRRVLAVDPDTRWCPAPDCSYAVVAAGCASCPKIKCERPGCGSYFCYHCKAPWHPNQTCDAARAQRSPNVRSSSLSFSQDSQHREDLKRCPRCQVLIVKMDDGSCNHMTCAVCGAEFCWLCMKEISDLHYLSPSGCTFWGKKPWSRKKKILWQLGTLVGAPVGIGLVAGIAVPAIIIGIPVWVGRKLYTRFEHANKHKRNLAIAGGVSASVLISPILATLAVGIGVPILLFYVYGVVPVSLCRSGGCGVSTSGTGVRFDFDDEGDVIGVLATKSNDGDTVSHPGGNPSIGEASLSLGSGSQLERDTDRESASFVALAGSTIAERLEVLADVVASQRFSVSSETASATTSLSDKSVADDGGASTRALAGSMLNFKMDNASLSNYRGASNDSSTANENVGGMANTETASQWSEPMSISSLEELTSNVSRKSARKNKVVLKDDAEEVTLERVRFDTHISYIDHNTAHIKHLPSRSMYSCENEPSTSKQDLVIEIQRVSDTTSVTSDRSHGDDSSFKGTFKADDTSSLAETGSQSVSSLDDVYSGLLKKTTVRKNKSCHRDDLEESGADRVRFDNHVSYLGDDSEKSPPLCSSRKNSPSLGDETQPSSSNKSNLRVLFFQGDLPQSRGSEPAGSLPPIPEPASIDSVHIAMPSQ